MVVFLNEWWSIYEGVSKNMFLQVKMTPKNGGKRSINLLLIARTSD